VKIDKNSGALQTTYPISIPPGRNGMQPNLDLVYNSQNMQQGIIFGEGWSIGIPYISRLNKSGVDNLYSTSTLNYFASSLEGELVSTSTVTSTGSSYIARTENGAFNKYTFTSSTNLWTMIDKNGTQYAFGLTSSSEQNDPNNSANVYKWMLQNATDTNGNAISYSYFKDSGQIYPSSTIYTANGTSTGIFEVDFQRATSTDNETSSASGFAVNSNYRVSEIDAKVNGTWARKYVLGYITGDNGGTALLGSIAESGENASGTIVSLPSSTFSYQTETPGWTSSSTWNPPTPFVANGGVDDGVRIADVNADSLSDIVGSSSAWIDNGAGWKSSSTWAAPAPFTTSGGGDNGVRIVDLNGDGLADVISSSSAWIDSGAGWTSSSTWTSPNAFATGTVSNGSILADLNGDGLPDILNSVTGTTPGGKGFQVDSLGTLTTNLVSYYKLEDATDFYGSNNLTNNNSVAFDAGKVNNAADFASSSSYLSLGAHLSGSTSSISTFGWVYLSSTSSKGGFWLNGDPAANSGNGDGYGLGVGSGSGNTDSAGNHLIGVIGNVAWLDFGTNIGTGWHLVGLTYDGTTWKGYIDGAQTSSTYTGALDKAQASARKEHGAELLKYNKAILKVWAAQDALEMMGIVEGMI
jgi:hypothetical protein